MRSLINVNFGFTPSSPEHNGAESDVRVGAQARLYEVHVGAESVRAVKASDPDAIEQVVQQQTEMETQSRTTTTNPLFEQASPRSEQSADNVLSLDAVRQTVEETYEEAA